MGRAQQYPDSDVFHRLERERVRRWRSLHRDVLKTVVKDPVKAVSMAGKSVPEVLKELGTNFEVDKNHPDVVHVFPANDSFESWVPSDVNVASDVRVRLCGGCSESVGCVVACERFRKLYDFEVVQKSVKAAGKNASE